jgi:predicted glycosyltransferase
LDPWAWLKDFSPDPTILNVLGINKELPLVVFRTLETQASYVRGVSSPLFQAIRNLIDTYPDLQIVIAPRYETQIKDLRSLFNGSISILTEAFDGASLLKSSTVFVGAGGTMTTEAALLGVPSISCHPKNKLHSHLWLKRRGLLQMADRSDVIVQFVEKYLDDSFNREEIAQKAREITLDFDDPLEVIIKVIETYN